MDRKIEYYSLTINISGRDYEEEWLLADDKDYKVWVSAQKYLSKFNYIYDGTEVVIQCDWSAVVERMQSLCSIHKDFLQKIEANESLEGFDFGHKSIVIQLEVQVFGSNLQTDYPWYSSHFVDQYLYDFFLIINLAMPGSCDFFSLTISKQNSKSEERISLSSYPFQSMLYEVTKGRHLPFKNLPLENVLDWYKSFNLGVRQKAETEVEKAIFSVLHICKLDIEITSIIWIFYALETLYKTRVGENFNALLNRISNLLNLSAKEKSTLKKTMRHMYDFRSSVVHGGYEVFHPLSNDGVDKRLDNDYSNIINYTSFGFHLIVVTLQIFIEKNWVGLDISETMHGIEMQDIG